MNSIIIENLSRALNGEPTCRPADFRACTEFYENRHSFPFRFSDWLASSPVDDAGKNAKPSCQDIQRPGLEDPAG